jgi:hypothetical protein
MARVNVLREVRSGDVGEWQLCFHWCRYVLDDGAVQYGYRFVWRRKEDGSIQAARGQARIPSFAWAKELMDSAANAGWGNRDGDKLEDAAERLRLAGCVVDFGSGFVGWPDKEAAGKGHLTEEMIADARLLAEWSH